MQDIGQTPPGSDERLRLEIATAIDSWAMNFNGYNDYARNKRDEALATADRILATDRLRSLLGELAEAGVYTEAHRLLDEDARERVAAAEASLSALRGEVGKGLEEARDLLKERIHGNPARSAGHNARLVIEYLLSTLEGNTVSRAIIAGSNSTVATDNPSSTGKEG